MCMIKTYLKNNSVLDHERQPTASIAPHLHHAACFDRTHSNEGGAPAGAPFGVHLSHDLATWDVGKISHWADMDGWLVNNRFNQ